MLMIIGFASIAAMLPAAMDAQSRNFSRYQAIEAYEIRPGILMMPRYSDDGKVCEVGLEKLHLSEKVVSLDFSLSRKAIDEIVDEMVPSSERGSRIHLLGDRDLAAKGGHSLVTFIEYENVAVRIYSRASPDNEENIAATITWKNRKCK